MSKLLKSFMFVVLVVMFFFAKCSKTPTGLSADENGKTNNGYFSVHSPGGGAQINLDSIMVVKWKIPQGGDSSSHVKLEIYRDSLFAAIIDTLAPNNGNYIYKPNNIGSGKNYRIKISSRTDTTHYDFGSFFNFVSDYSGTLVITFPTVNSRFMIGSSDTVCWTRTKWPGQKVRLDLYRDSSFVSVIVQSMYTAMGKYPWGTITSPRGSGSRYRIKITSESDPSIFSFSDYFTIASNYNGGFTIKQPAASAVLTSGTSYQIGWDTTGSPGPVVLMELYLKGKESFYLNTTAPNSGAYMWSLPKNITTDSGFTINISSAGDPALLATSGSFTIMGISRDRYEPDDIMKHAHLLVIDSTENHTITLNDTDWVSFTADSGASYIFQNPNTHMLAVTGTLFADTTGAAASVRCSLFTTSGCNDMWACNKNGKYYFRVLSDGPGMCGEYNLKVFRFDSSKLVLYTSPTISDTINAGSTLTIGWAVDSLTFGSSVWLYAYKGQKELFALSPLSIPNSGVFKWNVPNGFASGKDYSLRLIRDNDRRFFGQGPTFSINGMSPDSLEDDNLPGDGNKYLIGDLQNHSITYNDTDWIRISAVRGMQNIIVLRSHDTLRCNFDLFSDPSGKSILSTSVNANGESTVMWNPPSSTTYYGRITASANNLFGSYSIRLVPFDSLTSVRVTSPVTSSIIATGSALTVSWRPDELILGDSVSISLCKNGRALATLTSVISSVKGIFSWIVKDSLASGNDYRIKIANLKNSSFCGYSSMFTITDVPLDNYEPDAPPGTFPTIAVDSLQEHTISFNDIDYISFSADSGILYLLTVASPLSSFRISASIKAAGSVDAGTQFFATGNGQGTFTWPCTKTGVYNVKLAAQSAGLTGRYTFGVKVFDPEKNITFISPSSGTIWPVDSTVLFQWSSDGALFGDTVNISLLNVSKQMLQITSRTPNIGSFSWRLPGGLPSGSAYRIRLDSKKNPLLYGLSPTFSLIGMAADSFENDGSRETAVVYTPGTIQVHNITYNDTDWVSFNADSGAAFRVQLVGAPNLSSQICFYHDGNHDSVDQFSSSSGIIDKFWQFKGRSRVYAAIYSSDTSITSTGAYSLVLNRFDSLKAASFLSPKEGDLLSPSFNDVRWTSDTMFFGKWVNLQLYKGNVLVESNSTQNFGGSNFVISRNVIYGDDYTFKLVNSSAKFIYRHSPLFTVEGVTATQDGYEPDNDLAHASMLSLGQKQIHTFVLNDTDWVQFPVENGVTYIVKEKSTVNDIQTELCWGVNPTGMDRYTTSGRELLRKIIASSNGICYLKLSPVKVSGLDSVSLAVYKYTPGTFVSFTNPLDGSTFSGDTAVAIGWKCDTSLFGKSAKFSVYKGNSQLYQMDVSNTGQYLWSVPGLDSGSEYRIKLSSAFDSSINTYSPFFRINGFPKDVYEPDNQRSQASILKYGLSQSHTLGRNDTDWVRFEAKANTRYEMRYFASKGLNLRIEIVNVGTLRSSKYGTGGSWRSSSSGPYDIRITSNDWSVDTAHGTYVLYIAESEVINYDTVPVLITSPIKSQVLIAGQTINIQWPTDTVLLGSKVVLLLKNGSQVYAEIARNVNNNGLFSWTVPKSLVSGGNYNLVMYGASSEEGIMDGSVYSSIFSITGGIGEDSYEPDFGSNSPLPVTFGTLQQHTITFQDNDRILFEAETGMTYSVEVVSNTECLNLDVTKKDGTGKTSLGRITMNTPEVNNWKCSASGSYYLNFHAECGMFSDYRTGAYTVKITKL